MDDPRDAVPRSAASVVAALPLLVPAALAARVLGVSRKVLKSMIARGELRAVKRGGTRQGRVLVTRDSMTALLASGVAC